MRPNPLPPGRTYVICERSLNEVGKATEEGLLAAAIDAESPIIRTPVWGATARVSIGKKDQKGGINYTITSDAASGDYLLTWGLYAV